MARARDPFLPLPALLPPTSPTLVSCFIFYQRRQPQSHRRHQVAVGCQHISHLQLDVKVGPELPPAASSLLAAFVVKQVEHDKKQRAKYQTGKLFRRREQQFQKWFRFTKRYVSDFSDSFLSALLGRVFFRVEQPTKPESGNCLYRTAETSRAGLR